MLFYAFLCCSMLFIQAIICSLSETILQISLARYRKWYLKNAQQVCLYKSKSRKALNCNIKHYQNWSRQVNHMYLKCTIIYVRLFIYLVFSENGHSVYKWKESRKKNEKNPEKRGVINKLKKVPLSLDEKKRCKPWVDPSWTALHPAWWLRGPHWQIELHHAAPGEYRSN